MPYKDKDKQAEARKRYEEKRKLENRARHKCWTLIFYPDSAPDDWQSELSEIHLKVWVSPIHDQDAWTKADEDKNPQHIAGTLKKPHYHLVCQYETQVDRDTFLSDFGFLKGPQNVKAVKSLISMVRYLVHKDDPKKAQYDEQSMLVFGGAEKGLVNELGTYERHELLREMRRCIVDLELTDFAVFAIYCDMYEPAWSRLLDDNCAYVIEKFMKSWRYISEQYPDNAIDYINAELSRVAEGHRRRRQGPGRAAALDNSDDTQT